MNAHLKVVSSSGNPARDWFNDRLGIKGITGPVVARACGVNVRSMRQWVANARVSREHAPTLCELLDVSTEELSHHFEIRDSSSPSRRRGTQLEEMSNLLYLVRAALSPDCHQIDLADFEYVSTLPFDFSKPLDDSEAAAVQTLLKARKKVSVTNT